MTRTEARIITYISSKKQDIIANNDNFSFGVLPFCFEWNGKRGEINRIEIINDGTRHNNEKSIGKNYQKYQQFAPDTTQTDSWSSGQIGISFSEPVAKAEIKGQTLIIDGDHWVDMWKGIYLDSFELVEVIEDYNKGGDSKLALEIKERKITTSGFSPTISRLLINFGTTGAGMHEYADNLQVGKKYRFNGDNLQNAKILAGKTGNKLDINNSADNIPEIRVFKEEPEIITHGPTTPNNNQPVSSAVKEKILRNLDKICLDPTGELTNTEILKNDDADYYLKKGVYGSYSSEWKEWWDKAKQIEIDGVKIDLEQLSLEDYYEIKNALIREIKQNPAEWKIKEKKHTHWIEKTIRNKSTKRRHWKGLSIIREWKEIEALINGSPLPVDTQKTNDTELEKLKNIFQKLNIKKVIYRNGKLTIEFNNRQIISVEATNNQEYRALEKYCQEHKEKVITSKNLGIISGDNTSATPNKQNNHQLAIGLVVGASAVIVVGLITYFLIQKKKKK
jgi:hypothetical protein